MLGISIVRCPGVRCLKKNLKTLAGVVSSDGAFIIITVLIFLFLLISLSFRRIAFTIFNSPDDHSKNVKSLEEYSRPIISHKQLMELQSPGMLNYRLFNVTLFELLSYNLDSLIYIYHSYILIYVENILGLNSRESKLVNRVKEVENQNRFLRRQLSISQNQLMKSVINIKQNKLKKRNNRRRLSSDTNNDDNYYEDSNGMENDSNDENNEAKNEMDTKSSKCRVSFIMFLGVF